MSIQKSSGKWIHGPLTASGQRLLGISPSVLGYADEKADGAVFLYDGHYYVQENGKAWLETDIDENTRGILDTTSKMQREREYYLWCPMSSTWKCQGKRTLVFTSLSIGVPEIKNFGDWWDASLNIRRMDDEKGSLSNRGELMSTITHSLNGTETTQLLSIPAKLMGNREVAIHPMMCSVPQAADVVATTNVYTMRHTTIDSCFVYGKGDNWKIVAWGTKDIESVHRVLSGLITPTFNEWNTRCSFEYTDAELLHYFLTK